MSDEDARLEDVCWCDGPDCGQSPCVEAQDSTRAIRPGATTLSLTEFLLARIAEDEADASTKHDTAYHDYAGCGGCGYSARVMRECAAKRQIVEEHLAHVRHYESWPGDAVRRDARVAGRAIEFLAAIYSDHPDYRDEWKP